MHAATAHHEQLLKKSKGRSIKKPREVVTMVFQYLGELESGNIPNNLLPPFILENTCSPLLFGSTLSQFSDICNTEDLNAGLIWNYRVPNKVFLCWLLYKDKLNTKFDLLHKHIGQTSACTRY